MALTCHHLTGSNFPLVDTRCAFDTSPASCDDSRRGKRASGASASQDGPCPRLSEIISWVVAAVPAVCHAPLAVMSQRPALQNFGQLGAVRASSCLNLRSP